MINANSLKMALSGSRLDDCELYALPLQRACTLYNIDNGYRVAAFVAQVGHESAELCAVEENLNYSASALLRVFGKYFNAQSASEYARKPEKIANRVYANRMGNANESSGDGWKYRGRGLIQLTGRSNYCEITNKLVGTDGIDFTQRPELLTTPEWAAMSAAWFWSERGLNELADQLDSDNWESVFTKITKKINGGTNGLEHRLKLYETSLRTFQNK